MPTTSAMMLTSPRIDRITTDAGSGCPRVSCMVSATKIPQMMATAKAVCDLFL
jgi:hypothetical protein